MRILVYPHSMQIGGSQINAVQLAGAVRDRGHDVIVVSQAGPVTDRVRVAALERMEIPAHRRQPSPRAIGTLLRLVRERHIDVIHAYESMPIMEASFGPRLFCRTPVLGTIMSMSVRPFLPRSIPLTVCMEHLRIAAAASGHRRVTLLEPPIDTEADHPSVDGGSFRAKHGIASDEVLVAMVCRLARLLKLEGLLTACDAVGELARAGRQIRLLIAGDGESRLDVRARADQANAAAGRQAVLLTGEIADPRPVYAAADIVVGQGGSALRGMAFGKPVIVVGELGFVEALTPDTAPIFLRQGWYGLGPGSLGSGAAALRSALEHLASSSALRAELGAFGRRLAVERFSLRRAAQLLEEQYAAAVSEPVAFAPVDLCRSAGRLFASKLYRQYAKLRDIPLDDTPNSIAAMARAYQPSRAGANA